MRHAGVVVPAFGLVWRDIVDISIFCAGVSMVVAMLVIFSWGTRHRVSENALIFCGTVGLIGFVTTALLTPVGAPWLLVSLVAPTGGLIFWIISEKITTILQTQK